MDSEEAITLFVMGTVIGAAVLMAAIVF